MIEKAPIKTALPKGIDDMERLRDYYHQYYVKAFVEWLRERVHHTDIRRSKYIGISRSEWQALLKEAGERNE